MMRKQTTIEPKDFLWANLTRLPYFRAFLRAVEGRFYEDIQLLEPVLDVGCGDGIFAEITFDKKISVGFDLALSSLREPANRKAYSSILCAAGANIPFPEGYFSTVISNSVLEHIPEIDAVVAEIQRVLKPGGMFIFCVPNDNLLKNLSISNALDKIGLHRMADAYRTFFNTISRHHHADPLDVWQERLTKNGFQIEKWWHYFSPKNLHTLEWGHYFGLPALINKKIFGKWILFPMHWNIFIPEKDLRKQYDQNPLHPAGSYTFYITRKG
jgi:SAM-dependent methyltransferase